MPQAGITSLIDYVGYSVGAPPVVVPPACGYDGVLDWSGIPCGLLEGPPPPPPATTSGIGGGAGGYPVGERRKKGNKHGESPLKAILRELNLKKQIAEEDEMLLLMDDFDPIAWEIENG